MFSVGKLQLVIRTDKQAKAYRHSKLYEINKAHWWNYRIATTLPLELPPTMTILSVDGWKQHLLITDPSASP